MGRIGNTARAPFRELRPTFGHFSNPRMHRKRTVHARIYAWCTGGNTIWLIQRFWRVFSYLSHVLLGECFRAAFWLIFDVAPYFIGAGRCLWSRVAEHECCSRAPRTADPPELRDLDWRRSFPPRLVPVCGNHVRPLRQRPHGWVQGARGSRLWRLQLHKSALDRCQHPSTRVSRHDVLRRPARGLPQAAGPADHQIPGWPHRRRPKCS